LENLSGEMGSLECEGRASGIALARGTISGKGQGTISHQL